MVFPSFDDQKLSATLGFVDIRQSIPFLKVKGTIRGFHYLKYPANENKFVCCLTGSIFDVIVDIRRNSATYGAKHICRLSDAEPRILFVPQGFAHGFQTLSDDVNLVYMHTEHYQSELILAFIMIAPQYVFHGR